MKQTYLNSFLLLLLMSVQVKGITESMCFSKSFNYILQKNTIPHNGVEDIGSKRITPIADNGDLHWLSVFWTAPLNTQKVPPIHKFTVKYLTLDGMTMTGWLHIHMEFGLPLFLAAIWAVNERNEVYGQFEHGIDPSDMSIVGSSEPQYFIPCSAAPSNSDTIPSTFVYTAWKMEYSSTSKLPTFSKSKVSSAGVSRLSTVWRAPSQTFCNRPERFRFIFVLTHGGLWTSNWLKQSNVPYKSMHEALEMGPLLFNSDWIEPVYFGTPTNYVRKEGKLGVGDDVFKVSTGKWLAKTSPSPSLNKDPDWTYMGLFDNNNEISPNQPQIVRRATCRRGKLVNDQDGEKQWIAEIGRCKKPIDPKTTSTEFVEASKDAPLVCADESSQLGANVFLETYEEYLKSLKERMEGTCECQVAKVQPEAAAPFAHINMRSANSSSGDQSIREDIDSCLLVTKLTKEQRSKAGICVHGNPGKLIFGIRQWHAVTGLLTTLIITPMSIFLVRYTKGDITLVEGRLPLREWYSLHIMLVAPTMWMYASGWVTINRQVSIVGRSMTEAGRLHRILGYTVFALIPTHFLTGLLRPKNKISRRIMILIHWGMGITQHVLELSLCILSCQIPGSPTSGSSNLSPKFGKIEYSINSCLIIGWIAFSVLSHTIMTVKVKIDDLRAGMWKREVFPIIIPLFSEKSIEDIQIGLKQTPLFIISAAFFYAIISCIVFAISVVALYQLHSPYIYYGHGRLTCTHHPNGQVKNISTIVCNYSL